MKDCLLVGRLTSDLNIVERGEKTIGLVDIAVRDAGNQEEVSYFHLQVWNKVATTFASSLKKGSAWIVSGELSQNRWNDPDSGKMNEKVVINVRRLTPIEFCFPKKRIEEKDKIPMII